MKVQKLKMFESNVCIHLDKIDSVYAFDGKSVIECNTDKEKKMDKGSFIKRTRSAGWMAMIRTCNTRSWMYEMYRGESRLQL